MLRGRTPVQLRWMLERDLTAILAIEQESFAQPRTEKEVRATLGRTIVAESREVVVGYSVLAWQQCDGLVFSLAVVPHLRREGIATQLLERSFQRLVQQGCRTLMVVVRERNLSAQLFLRQMRLESIGVARGHFEDTGEDAYVLARRLQSLPRRRSRLSEPLDVLDIA